MASFLRHRTSIQRRLQSTVVSHLLAGRHNFEPFARLPHKLSSEFQNFRIHISCFSSIKPDTKLIPSHFILILKICSELTSSKNCHFSKTVKICKLSTNSQREVKTFFQNEPIFLPSPGGSINGDFTHFCL